MYARVDQIKVVVKQPTGFSEFNISNIEPGALTDKTTKAMKVICDETMGLNSQYDRRDKLLGCMYVRTHKITGQKYQVMRSTGKHKRIFQGLSQREER